MSISDSSKFYANLPLVKDFFDASLGENYHPLPENWHVAVADIVNSTSAIEENRYKAVNILGASPIVGILNLADRNEIPYVFAGDGSTFCIPPNLLDDTRSVLGASRRIGKEEFNLDLRAAIIPISYIREQGYDVRVARYAASDIYIQAIFSGGGVTYAEERFKSSGIDEFHVAVSNNAESVDFSGLECRWQEVKQQENEVITLLAKTNPGLSTPEPVYEQLFHEMRNIFGFDDKTNPLKASKLSMNMGLSDLMGELKFRTFGKGWLASVGYFLKMQLQIIIGKLFMALDYETSVTDWSLYKSDMVLNSDHRKFDDMLRMVISGSKEQRKMLENFLEERFLEGELAYGIHISDAAMITCMVFQYHREHVHFVDGNEGGYVAASKKLKKRLKQLEQREVSL
ncbi:MAG TPA: DUF3095 domain-containing protein [Balneolaceae bacterium]|nr:DUF3095 domain-containing protein [Balneolaceae bacterium]